MNVIQSRMLLDEAGTNERMLAFVRSVLALATLVVAVKLYFEVQFEYRPMALTLALVLSYSLMMSLVTRHRPKSARNAAIFSSAFEVALITVLIASTGGSQSPFYLWYVFYVVSVSLRYGLQLSIVALAASIVSYTIITTSAVSLSLAGETFIPAFLGSTGFLFILALLFGHMSERQKSYRAQLAVVNELGIALSSLVEPLEIEMELVRQTGELLQVEKAWLAVRRDRESAMFSWIGEDAPADGLTGDWSPENIAPGQPRMSNDMRKETPPQPSPKGEGASFPSFRRGLGGGRWSLAAAPLSAPETGLVGVIYAVNRKTGPFRAADLRLLELIASQAAPLLENARLSERLREAAASEERVRIARDLHDNFLQTLAAIKLHLERCNLLIAKNPGKAKEAIDRTQEIAASGLAEARSYLSQLRLAGPEPRQFGEAVKRFVDETAATAGFEAKLTVDVDPDSLSSGVCLAAFQILRELVNNSAKHARAKEALIAVSTDADGLTIRVRDDGAGFNIDEARQTAEASGHIGLIGIEERLKAFGGSLAVESSPGEGTCVTIRLPLAK